MKQYILAQINEAQRVMSAILADDNLILAVQAAAKACITTLQHDGKILLAGNGGSATYCGSVCESICI